MCSAQYTERCWPPVQPKLTIRLVNPRREYVSTCGSTTPYACSRKPNTSPSSSRNFITGSSRPVSFLYGSYRPGLWIDRQSNTYPPPFPDGSCGTHFFNEKLYTLTSSTPSSGVSSSKRGRATRRSNVCLRYGYLSDGSVSQVFSSAIAEGMLVTKLALCSTQPRNPYAPSTCRRRNSTKRRRLQRNSCSPIDEYSE